jgi:hypothetical protein
MIEDIEFRWLNTPPYIDEEGNRKTLQFRKKINGVWGDWRDVTEEWK